MTEYWYIMAILGDKIEIHVRKDGSAYILMDGNMKTFSNEEAAYCWARRRGYAEIAD